MTIPHRKGCCQQPQRRISLRVGTSALPNTDANQPDDAALIASMMRRLMALWILGGLLALVSNSLTRWIAAPGFLRRAILQNEESSGRKGRWKMRLQAELVR
jgi:hypothetical protein